MAVLAFGVIQPNLPHWATARMAEGVRFSRVFDHGVKGWLTELNAGCQGVRRFSQEGLANSYKGWCLVCFRRLERDGYCRLPLQNQWFGFGHLITSLIADVPSFALRTSVSVRCIAVAAVCRTPSGELSWGCSRLTKPAHSPPPTVWSQCWRLLSPQLSNHLCR